MKRKIIPVLLLAVLLLAGCGRERKEIHTLKDMKNMSLVIGQPDDADTGVFVRALCPNAQFISQNDQLLGVRAIAEGKIDAYAAGRDHLEKAIEEGKVKGVRILEEPVHTYACALGLSRLCKIPDFENAVNKAVESLLADGTLDGMRKRWFKEKNEEMPEIKLDEKADFTLNAVTFGQSKPYSFVKNGELTGYDVELIYRVCQLNHWNVELSHASYEGMLMGLSTGKYDMIAADLYVTENRQENITYSIPYKYEDIAMAVRDSSVPSSGETEEPVLEYSSLDALEGGKKFAVLSGAVSDSFLLERYPDAKIEYFPNAVDCVLALTSNKVDAAAYDAPVWEYMEACTEGVAMLPDYIATDHYHLILPKSERGEQLQKEFNEWLAVQKQSGEIARLHDFWCSSAEPDTDFDFNALPETNGKIRLVANAALRPDVYYFNNRPSGFPIELVYNFCRDMGYRAELSVVPFESMLATITSEKADIGLAFLSYTEERAQSVLFTDTMLESGLALLVRTTGKAEKASFSDTLKSGLIKTFVTEDRWQLIASGLGVTLLITLGGFLLANLLGTVFCACTMSKSKVLQILADAVDRIMQGTPMVVVLMILYYVIFGKSSISGIWVAIFAFGLSSGTSLARQFYGAITGVDKGQTEAALAIGFTKPQAFLNIVLPQAARTALPGYFSELISLMKGTAIVGYISVIDLTKAGDLIRSSTYDAFFPLLSAAVIYFLISFGLLSLLKRIQKMLAPKRVVTQEVEK